MKYIVAAASGLFILSACGSERSGTIETDDGETVAYSVNSSDGEATATVKSADGTVTARAGANVPVELPNGFTIYPGAEVLNNVVFDRNGDKGAMVSMKSDASADEMIAFYRKQAEAAGIAIEADVKNGAMIMIGGESKDGAGFSFMATPDGDSTGGQLMIGDSFE